MPLRNVTCRDFLMGILIFKGLIARRLCKSFGVKGLRKERVKCCIWSIAFDTSERRSEITWKVLKCGDG
jgi:hypothetical protein